MTEREKQEIDNIRILLRMMSESDQQFTKGFFKCAEMLLPHIQEKKA